MPKTIQITPCHSLINIDPFRVVLRLPAVFGVAQWIHVHIGSPLDDQHQWPFAKTPSLLSLVLGVHLLILLQLCFSCMGRMSHIFLYN